MGYAPEQLLNYSDTPENNEREWTLIHVRDDHMKTLDQNDRLAINGAHTDCDRCGENTPVAVRCHECGNWLGPAAIPDLDEAKEEIVKRDAEIVAAAA